MCVCVCAYVCAHYAQKQQLVSSVAPTAYLHSTGVEYTLLHNTSTCLQLPTAMSTCIYTSVQIFCRQCLMMMYHEIFLTTKIILWNNQVSKRNSKELAIVVKVILCDSYSMKLF